MAQSPEAVHVLIPGAGVGARAGTPMPKQYQVIAGRALVAHTLAAFEPLQAQGLLSAVWLVVSAGDEWLPEEVATKANVLRCGGDTRAASVANGLTQLVLAGVPDTAWVLVHDAARCLITPALVRKLLAAGQAQADSGQALPGALLALPLPDTLKQSDAEGRVAGTVAREDKWLAQTPQMFRLGELRAALQAARQPDGSYPGITDEASAMECQGACPRLVASSAQNFKVTYPEDFALAEAILSARMV